MKNNVLNNLKETKKKVDLQSGKHLCILLAWIGVYFVVSFQPESTLRTWVLIVCIIACIHRIWAHGRFFGVSEFLNSLIENFTSKESSSDKVTATLQEIGNAGVKVKSEN